MNPARPLFRRLAGASRPVTDCPLSAAGLRAAAVLVAAAVLLAAAALPRPEVPAKKRAPSLHGMGRVLHIQASEREGRAGRGHGLRSSRTKGGLMTASVSAPYSSDRR